MARARRALIVTAWLAAMARADHAAAQAEKIERAERVRVELSMSAACAQRERFRAQLDDRLGPGWEASSDELARTIHVTVAPEGGRYVARIELTDARGRRVKRAVAGTQCENVVDGIALITVLAIQAQLDELISRSEPVEPEATTTEARQLSPATAPSPPAVGRSAPARPEPRGHGAARPTIRIAGRAGLQQGIGPELTPVFGGFVGTAWSKLALALAFDAAATGEVRSRNVPTELELWAARIEGCRRFRLPRLNSTFEPCAFVQAGQLSAEGIRAVPIVAQGSRGTTLWLLPGLLLAVRGNAGPVFLGLEGWAGFSLDRETFYLDVEGARRPVYQVPTISSGSALCAGVVF